MNAIQFRNRKFSGAQQCQSKLKRLLIWLSRILKLGFLIWLCSNLATILLTGLLAGTAWYFIYPLVKARRTDTYK